MQEKLENIVYDNQLIFPIQLNDTLWFGPNFENRFMYWVN